MQAETVEQYLGMPTEAAGDRLLARARAYVEIETPSGSEAQIERLGALIRGHLEACGATVSTVPVPGFGVTLRGRVPGADPALAPIVVLAHMDTVHPMGTLAERPFRIADGRAFGPGLYDMKTGLASAVEALTWLAESGRRPRRPVHLLFTCDEEIGSHSAHDLIIEEARGAGAVLVPEPCMPDGGVKTFRKGVATYCLETTGIAAHAGIEGARAVSAITELIHALDRVLKLADHDRGTTINIGTVAGGTTSNVVAAEAVATIDVRLAEAGEDARVHEAVLALRASRPEAALRVIRTENRPPLLRSPQVVALYEQARGQAAALGVTLQEGGTGGGSDGSIAAAAGAATLDGLGPLGGGAHAIDEHIVLADLPFRLAFMARLLENL